MRLLIAFDFEAERANLKNFESLLAKVPDADPDSGDEMSPKKKENKMLG